MIDPKNIEILIQGRERREAHTVTTERSGDRWLISVSSRVSRDDLAALDPELRGYVLAFVSQYRAFDEQWKAGVAPGVLADGTVVTTA